MDSIPGWGTKIPHAAGQLSSHATAKTRYSQINIKKNNNVLETE